MTFAMVQKPCYLTLKNTVSYICMLSTLNFTEKGVGSWLSRSSMASTLEETQNPKQ